MSEKIHRLVRAHYAQVANQTSSCCASTHRAGSSCCSPAACDTESTAESLGYTKEDLAITPEGANLGLGCGNPVALAELRPGEIVLDLGCGAGFDCFLAAQRVGPGGRVIGVDMTPEMIARARQNAEKSGASNVEFRLGEIEHVPVADSSIDVVMSNCVINLAADKAAVYREAYRVLKPGGRLSISDVVAIKPLPPEWQQNPDLYCGCVAGAIAPTELEMLLEEAGFEDIIIRVDLGKREVIAGWAPDVNVEDYVAPAMVQARRPAST